MSFYIFITVSTLVNVLLYLLVRFKSYGFSNTLPLLGLAFVFPLCSILGVNYLNGGKLDEWSLRFYCIAYIASTMLLKEFVKRFLREYELKAQLFISQKSFSLTFLLRICGILAILACCTLPLVRQFVVNGVYFVPFNKIGVAVISIQLIIALYSLFILENTFRFAQDYQRKIGRLCFLALFIILVSQLIFSSHLLLYKVLNENLLYISAVVYGVSYPFLLIGLLRYRLGSEHIAIPRNAVFSTVSLLLSGAVFLGIGLTVMIFKQFDIDFTYFEQTLIIFSLCFFALLIFGSGSMRRRISRFVNHNFYLRKFDYREQFYNLHRSYMTGENVANTLTEIIETMKYTVTTQNAFIFIGNETDGHFYMHENKESSTVSDCVIRGDSNIVEELSQTFMPIELKMVIEKNAMLPADPADTTFREIIKADVLFPIASHNRLLGILALKLGSGVELDKEDKSFIEVFASSIGDVLFKNRLLVEHVESKQFESFSHLSSFIIHDIKNQIATLSLLNDNANKNIDNPEFRKSLLVTLQSCTNNLKLLVEKLKSPPKSGAIKLKRLDINIVIDRVIENTGVATLGTVLFDFKRGHVLVCETDEESLFYAVKNLVVNSLDAMNNKGNLAIATGSLRPPPDRLLKLVNSGKEFFSAYNNYIIISDTGCGMSREFVETKLFHPFSTTKDKGFGIGLYQCKTLIEKMGGKIICRSEVGHGTDFCILL
jgi:putative PEP-CTERM system histidine kinase